MAEVWRSRRHAAWIAASLFVIRAARSTIRSPIGTIWSIATSGCTALETLHSTNNFPEFTGRDSARRLDEASLHPQHPGDNPVTIKTIECQIVDRGWEEGWIHPQTPAKKSGKTVAVVGSGPAGLACAQQLARAGHSVTLFEKADRIGGLLRYGIPDFKMEKHPD